MRAHRRSIEDLLATARAELATNTTVTVYEMVGGRPVCVSAWCPLCGGPRPCDVLAVKHSAIPDFLICTQCGNGVAADELEAA